MTKQTSRQIDGNSISPPAAYARGVDVADVGVVRFAVSTRDICPNINIAGTCRCSRTSFRAYRRVLIAARELAKRCDSYACVPVPVNMVVLPFLPRFIEFCCCRSERGEEPSRG